MSLGIIGAGSPQDTEDMAQYKETFYVSPSGTGTVASNSVTDPLSPANFQTHLAQNRRNVRYVFQGGVYEFNATLTVSSYGVELIGSGSADATGPATRFMFGTSPNTGVAFTGAGPYTATVTGTVKAVYWDDTTAYAAATSRGRPLKKTRNTGTPTTPGAGEWGQSGATLYLGDNPAGRTVRIVTANVSGITVGTGCDELSIRGIEVGYTDGHGLTIPAAQGSGQLNASNIYLDNFWVFGCYDDTDAAGAVANNGINCQSPCNIYAKRINIDWIDNDGINLKQQCNMYASGVFVDRCGDDCVSPHYGAHLEMSDFILRNPRQITTDGNGITFFAGGSGVLNNGHVYAPTATGIMFQNAGTQYPGSRVQMTDVVCSNGDWGTGGEVGFHFQGTNSVVATRCKAIGWQNGTLGFGFYFDDAGSTNIHADVLLQDCIAIKCRANVRTNRASATNTMRLDAINFKHVDATVAEISHAGAVPLTTGGTSTDESAVAGITVQNFWLD